MPVSFLNSPAWGVITADFFLSISGFAPHAPMASASMTIGLVHRCTNRWTPLIVSGAEPRPGPIATTSTPRENDSSSVAWSSESLSPSSDRTIRLGECTATGSAAGSGVATNTRSAPARMVAMPANAGAPVYGPPPMTRTLPASPFLASGLLLGNREKSPGPQYLSASSGMPMSATTILPESFLSMPFFGAWKVTVALARTRRSDGQPEGTSTDTTGFLLLLRLLMVLA